METLTIINTIEKKEVKNGYGHCQKDGCNCGAFRDVTGTFPKCANTNCKHNFEDHY